MAAKLAKPATAPTDAVAIATSSVRTTTPPPALGDLSKYANQGVSKAQEDNLVPLIGILQKLSPEIDQDNHKFIEGAEAGDFVLRNAADPIVKGNEGFNFQPCFFSIDWVEWVPRDTGGGFVTRHTKRPEDAKRMVDPQNPNRVRWLRPNNNEVIETRYHAGYVIKLNEPPAPFVIPMTSTGHTASRGWMLKMNQKLIPGTNESAPTFATLYHFTTRKRQNVSGTWFTWEIHDAGWVQSNEDVERGAALFQAFLSGEKRAMEEESIEPVAAADAPM
jgi:hypothetical protein